MSNSFNTTNSSLFLNNIATDIPDWMDNMIIPDQSHNNELEVLSPELVKEAAFNTMPSVQRNDAITDTYRTMYSQKNSTQLALLAKIELAKFLSGKHYTVNTKEHNYRNGSAIECEVNIANIPATFIFKYSINNNSHIAQNKTFIITSIRDDTSTEAEYPWSSAGFREALDDIKTGRVKTANKAQTYQAYTITLGEVLKRYNGDARQAMDRVRELLASQEIIGVGSNEFASIYTMDSLFPGLQKEGSVDNAPIFEFVKNIEHVAAKPYSSGAKLVTEATSHLKNLVDDFQILSSFRQDDQLIINAKILKKGITHTASFNFDIINDKVDHLKFIQSEGKKINVDQLNNTDLFNIYQQRNNANTTYINQKIVLSSKDIHTKLSNVVDTYTIDQLIANWEARGLITRIASDKFTSDCSFNDLLNQVDTKVLSDDEAKAILKLAAKKESNFNRINQKDTGVRNDFDIIISQNIRLCSLYNRLVQYLDNFQIVSFNDDVTEIKINNFSERGKEEVTAVATYYGNILDKLKLRGNKTFTNALKTYKQYVKHNTFAKAIFSESNLYQIISQLFDNPQEVISLIKTTFHLVDLGNKLFASELPLSAILNTLEQNNLAHSMNDEDRKDFLAKLAKKESNFNRINQKDTGVRNDFELESSRMLRLAAVYNYLANKINNFSLKHINDTAEHIELDIYTEHGVEPLTIIATYHGNKLKKINIPKLSDNSSALNLYKSASHNKKVITAQSIFSKDMLTRVYRHIFKDVPAAIQLTLEKYAKPIHNNYYASNFAIAHIIHNLSSELDVITQDERHELLQQAARNQDKVIVASYLKDSGYRSINDVLYSATIRLANVYHALSKNHDKFVIASFNKDISQVTIGVPTIIGLQNNKYEIEYDGNTPKNIIHISSFNPENKKIIKQYQNVHGKQAVANKAIFSRAMIRTALKPLVDTKDLEPAVNTIINKATALGNQLFGSDKSLIELINDSNIEYMHPEALDKDGVVNREDVKDTGVRDIVFNDSLISMIDTASAYLNKIFKHFSLISADLKDNVLNYSAKLFDDNSGLTNNIYCKFNIENGHVKDCRVNINGKDIPIKDVQHAFTTNNILKRYLEFNPGTKTNAPIILSTNKLAAALKDIIADNKQIENMINTWEDTDKIKRIASNAFVSNYTLEHLLSISNLVPLSDEELKRRLNRKNSLYRVSATYIKNTPTRQIVDNWDIDKFIRFAREQLSRKYHIAQILDADLSDTYFSIKARIPQNGIMTISNFNWQLEDGKPTKLISDIPTTTKLVQDYTSRLSAPLPYHEKVIININALTASLLGLVNQNDIHNALEYYIDNGILTKLNSTQIASPYSIQELIKKMQDDKLINTDMSKQEIDEAARVTPIYHVEAADSTMRPMPINKNDIALKDAADKIIYNIRLAAKNQLITKRKHNEWIQRLQNDINNIITVTNEFKQYLAGK